MSSSVEETSVCIQTNRGPILIQSVGVKDEDGGRQIQTDIGPIYIFFIEEKDENGGFFIQTSIGPIYISDGKLPFD